MRYRKKPVEVEAFLLTEDVEVTAPRWFTDAVAKCEIDINVSLVDGSRHIYGCTIRTPTGKANVKLGDYIIKGIQGEIYPCKAGIFKKIYEKCG